MTSSYAPAHAELATLLDSIAIALERGDFAAALGIAEPAQLQFPGEAELKRLHAIALLQLGQHARAVEMFERIVEMAPDNVAARCNLGSALMAAGRTDDAIEQLRAALRQSPGHPDILMSLGNALMAAARYQHARESYAMATHGAPAHPGLRLNLAAAEFELGHVAQAELHIGEALQMQPRLDAAHALRGRIAQARRQPAAAALAWLSAMQLSPQNPHYAFAAGQAYEDAGQLRDAARAYERALQLDPADSRALGQLLFLRRRLYDWRDLDELGERVRHAVEQGAVTSPFAMLSEDVDAALQLRCASAYAAQVEERVAPLRKQLAFAHARPAADAPLRIGFVADGFNQHATGLLTVAMFETLAREPDGLELHLFATAPDDGGPIRHRLAATGALHDVSALSHADMARRIHATRIEILFDLNGYSGLDNAELFALRPAPVQVNWLAYPGSSGAPWMDYLLADHIVLPDALRAHVSEKLLRLPRCYQPSDTSRVLATPPSRAECSLPEHGTVFACFNNSYKLNPTAFARMLLIVQQVPDSVLWLLSAPEDADEHLRAAAIAAGLAPERLVFLPHLPHADYLARYAHADLFLDTLPYNAHTTASDALWAGCPVLTCTGRTFAGRVATSLLHALGLPELASEDEAAFIDMAVELGKDRAALAALRQHLARQRAQSTLFDMPGYARDFRHAVKAIGARHRIGRPPADLDLHAH